jgi:hypothetical protein
VIRTNRGLQNSQYIFATKNLAGVNLHCNRSVVSIPRVRVCRVSIGQGFSLLLYLSDIRAGSNIVLNPISQGTN